MGTTKDGRGTIFTGEQGPGEGGEAIQAAIRRGAKCVQGENIGWRQHTRKRSLLWWRFCAMHGVRTIRQWPRLQYGSQWELPTALRAFHAISSSFHDVCDRLLPPYQYLVSTKSDIVLRFQAVG